MKGMRKAWVAVVALVVAVVVMLTGCKGKGTLGSELVEETGAYRVIATDAPKDSTVAASGAVVVEEGQVLVVSPDLVAGSLQVRLIDSEGKVAFDEKMDGRILSTYDLEPGAYAIEVTCTENGTEGSLLVVAWDKDEYAQQEDDLAEALEDALATEDAA